MKNQQYASNQRGRGICLLGCSWQFMAVFRRSFPQSFPRMPPRGAGG